MSLITGFERVRAADRFIIIVVVFVAVRFFIYAPATTTAMQVRILSVAFGPCRPRPQPVLRARVSHLPTRPAPLPRTPHPTPHSIRSEIAFREIRLRAYAASPSPSLPYSIPALPPRPFSSMQERSDTRSRAAAPARCDADRVLARVHPRPARGHARARQRARRRARHGPVHPPLWHRPYPHRGSSRSSAHAERVKDVDQ